MKKITTLFKKNPENLGRVINEVSPENQWVMDGEGRATRKFDGSACAIINGELYKRYDVKKGRQVPANAIPCQDPDPISGHWPHWVKCLREEPGDKYFWEGFDNLHSMARVDGTYELIGEKVQGNPERLIGHHLFQHGQYYFNAFPRTWEGIQEYLQHNDIEGIVFHHPDGRMCKIRKSDFGIKR